MSGFSHRPCHLLLLSIWYWSKAIKRIFKKIFWRDILDRFVEEPVGRELSPCCKNTLAYSARSFLSLSHTYMHTHCFRQLVVSGPQCRIKDSATLWVLEDAQIQTHIHHAQLSVIYWGGGLLSGTIIPHAFLHTVCVKIWVTECACVGLFGGAVICFISQTWGTQTQSQNSMVLNSISIHASNFSPQTHNGAVIVRWGCDHRESGKMREQSERWGKTETKEEWVIEGIEDILQGQGKR